MNLQEEADVYRADLRRTIPSRVSAETRGWEGYAGLNKTQKVEKYMADISERIFPEKSRVEFKDFLEARTNHVDSRTLYVLLFTFKGVESFLPSVRIRERAVPVGMELFSSAPDYLRALDLVTA